MAERIKTFYSDGNVEFGIRVNSSCDVCGEIKKVLYVASDTDSFEVGGPATICFYCILNAFTIDMSDAEIVNVPDTDELIDPAV